MKLLALKIEAKGLNGWESPRLAFGERTTVLFAPNGSGKTPVVQAVAYCLGYPTIFREDIYEKCAAVALEIEIDGSRFKLQRTVDRSFHATLTPVDGEVQEFFSEKELSLALFELLRMEVPALVSTGKEETQPYMSTLLPVFYLNQDGGYNQAYYPPRPFITDQFVEMVRFLFGLAPKHSFYVKKDLLGAKEQLDAVNKRIVAQQKVLTDLARTVDDRPESVQRLEGQSQELQRQLAQFRETLDLEGSAQSALTDNLAMKDAELRTMRATAEELRLRISGIEGIRAEIDAELDTLSLTEESKRVFESFEEICRNPDCGLFLGSSEAYGKNLVYLKDQLKDLERNASRSKVRLEELESRIQQRSAERSELAVALAAAGRSSSGEQLVAAVQQITVTLFNLEQERGRVKILSQERSRLLNLETERDRLHDRIANLSNTGAADISFNRLRLDVKELVVKWLDVLQTLNVSRDIQIDLDFRFKFGKEPLEAITGSTRIRVVLAIHAALLELYLRDKSRPFRFLILDTPKQQEMQTRDLADFLLQLSNLCRTESAQLLLSSTEYRFPVEADDVEWLPQYPGPRQPMYLGAPPAA